MRVRSVFMLLTAVAVAASMACSPSREEPSDIPAGATASAGSGASGSAEPSADVTGGGEPTATGTASNEQVISVSVVNGTVNPAPGPVDVKLGDAVIIEVTADADDEIHVHGYELTAPVTAGQPARVAVAATIPGQFEVELHDSGLLLLMLRVQ